MRDTFSHLSFTDEEISKFNEEIHIKGARSNNLKNIEVHIPKNQLVVVTGLSGSGKSSLIMDTLYAEGQRRYVESLSSYARQFLNRMKKPEVDFIKGISPAIAIEQKVSGSNNARSTVGSLTEIYDYLRLLFARIGKTYSPISGELVTKHSVSDVIDYLLSLKEGTKVLLLAPFSKRTKEKILHDELDILLKKGYSRLYYEGELFFIEEILDDKSIKWKKKPIHELTSLFLLIDRFAVSDEEANRMRMADSVLTALAESEGECRIQVLDGDFADFNNRFELDGMEFLEPSPQLFNYNNPFGACPTCEGYGKVLGIDQNKVIPDENKSVYDGAIAAWKGEKSSYFQAEFLRNAHFFDFPVHRPIKDLTKEEYDLLWRGNSYFQGLDDYFEEIRSKNYKIQNRVLLARFRGRTTCPTCKGGRLRPETDFIRIDNHTISDLIFVPISDLADIMKSLNLSEWDQEVSDRILYEVNSRLAVMTDVGLSYLSLDRISSTLSGGETQRINLTRMLGSNLTNSLYILDEPSVGLHPKDTSNLIRVLKSLRDLDNTVVVVEHEEEVIKNADYLIDIGPKAGIFGGELVFSGPYKDLLKHKNESLTLDYLTGRKKIEIPSSIREPKHFLEIKGARHHNLKNIDVKIPLNALTVVAGVSGSGKTTLIKHLLYPAMKLSLGESLPVTPGKFSALEGAFNKVQQVEMISQHPIGRSSRSNPITYVKAYDSIRSLFTKQQLSKIRGYKPKHFSFNVEGGRCENCKGDGEITVEMQFLADIKLTCEDCKGKRFKQEILEVNYNGKNIYDVLELSVEEAMDFFSDQLDIIAKIEPLHQVGLSYVKLGQASSTLSGGEAQRVKLASYLNKEGKNDHVFFIFDEPTTGLHFHDIQKLLDSFQALINNGHSVLVVEHNIELMKCADWLVELGPVGGKDGGHLMYQGKPEGIIKIKNSPTAEYLKDKF